MSIIEYAIAKTKGRLCTK